MKAWKVITIIVFSIVATRYFYSGGNNIRDIQISEDKNEVWFHINGSSSIFWNGNNELVYVGSLTGKPTEDEKSVLFRWPVGNKAYAYSPKKSTQNNLFA